jgi:hypothetical protein
MSFGHRTQPFSFLGKKAGGGFFTGFTGADGDLTVLNGQDITLPVKPSGVYDYNNVIIQAGGILRLPENGGQILTFGALSLQNDGTFYGNRGAHAGTSDSITTVAGDNFNYTQTQQAGGGGFAFGNIGSRPRRPQSNGNGGQSLGWGYREYVPALSNNSAVSVPSSYNPFCAGMPTNGTDANINQGGSATLQKLMDNTQLSATPCQAFTSTDLSNYNTCVNNYRAGLGGVSYGQDGGPACWFTADGSKAGYISCGAGGGHRGYHGQACIFYISILSGSGVFNFNGQNGGRGGFGGFNANCCTPTTRYDLPPFVNDPSYNKAESSDAGSAGGGAGGNGGFVRLKTNTNNFTGSWQANAGAGGGTGSSFHLYYGQQPSGRAITVEGSVYGGVWYAPEIGSNGLAGSFANF